MHDIRYIRDNSEDFDRHLARRGITSKSHEILTLDASNRAVLTELQQLQSERNALAKSFAEAKRNNLSTDLIAQQSEKLKSAIADNEKKAREYDEKLHEILSSLPNLPAVDVPDGDLEENHKEVLKWGAIKNFSFTPKQHYELGENLGLMDFENAVKTSGARFVLLKGKLSRLERAISQFMLDEHTQNFGYVEVTPPLLVNDASMFGTGQLPKFREDQFQTTHGLWLIPTAEVSLTNIVAQNSLALDSLPIRYTAYTPCFRAEAGAAGRDTRGMIRNHQFTKVELVSVTTPDESDAEHERMTNAAENILQKLNLPYRKLVLCAGDFGFCAKKTYDLEVWLPGANAYREISSCSNCGDFQARRMNSKYRNADGKLAFVHTLNGSGLAVGRTLVAVLENYQEADGSISIPEVLRPYTGFSKIEA
jgi:seryl-tRNA synthetase